MSIKLSAKDAKFFAVNRHLVPIVEIGKPYVYLVYDLGVDSEGEHYGPYIYDPRSGNLTSIEMFYCLDQKYWNDYFFIHSQVRESILFKHPEVRDGGTTLGTIDNVGTDPDGRIVFMVSYDCDTKHVYLHQDRHVILQNKAMA